MTNLFTADVNFLVILAHSQLKENVCCHPWQYKYFHDPLKFVNFGGVITTKCHIVEISKEVF
jgi:hypothetical protein